jgi:DtxR family manganese transport transcriptional regulator
MPAVRRSTAPSQPASSAPARSTTAQASSLSKARQDNAREIAEDYVEAIADLITLTGEARVVDLARTLGVTHVTVSRTITRLQRQGFVRSEPYRSIFLTESGAALARDCKSRHETVTAFLRALGVRRETAERDAEGIEHHVSDETLAAFLKFLHANG